MRSTEMPDQHVMAQAHAEGYIITLRNQDENTSAKYPRAAGPGSRESVTPEERARALRAVYEAHLRGVYHYLYQRVGNREQAEDLTSQVFLKAARDLDVTRGDREIGAWLLQVARTTLVDHWRQVYALHTASLERLQEGGWEPSAATSPSEAAQETEERVAAVLDRLPARARQVLVCRFLRGLSLQETAVELGMSLANVKVAQLRALRQAARLADASG